GWDRGLRRGTGRRSRHARRHDRGRQGGGARGDPAMNGIHDLGGMHGLGPVGVGREGPVFHPAGGATAFALTVATGFLGKWNLDMSRSAREQMPAAEYLATTYYEHWLFGLRKLLV